VIQAQHVLDAARDFRAGFARLSNSQEIPIRSLVLTASAAVELYIKYLSLQSCGTLSRGKNIDELFARLPTDIRSQIGAKYHGSGAVAATLRAMKDSFVDWQYIFERRHRSFPLALNDLKALVEAFESTAAAA
jgi:hypothetical protein